MSIYPDDISTRDFLVVSEGYDRDEVRTFLQVLAREQQALRDEVETLRAEINTDGDAGSEVASVLLAAQSAAEEALRLATKEADELRGRAQDDSDRLRKATVVASEKTREEAERDAVQAREQAERDARQTLDDATERVERLLDGAEKVRDRLFGLDAILGSVRSEVAEAAEALDEVERPESEAPVMIDLREVSAG
jgi:cell division septum initiation protein DivIVA